MAPPPGIVYLSRRARHVILPPTIVVCVALIANRATGITLPVSLVVLASILALPLTFVASVLWKDHADARDAAANGARLPPRVESNKIGGFDIIRTVQHNYRSSFLLKEQFEWTQRYGNVYNFRVLFQNRMFTCEPEDIKLILATDFNTYEKGFLGRSILDSLFGTGVFNSDGDMWKFHRTMSRPFFSRDRISHFDIFDRHAEDAIGQLRARLREGHAVDFQDLVSRFTLDSATEFLFGKDVRSLSAGLPYPPQTPEAHNVAAHPSNRFAQAFLEAQVRTFERTAYGANWPLFEFWKDEVADKMQVIHEFIDPLLRDVLSKKAERGVLERSKEEMDDDETLLSYLARLTDDRAILKDETLNILLAGRDTTAATLTFAVYMLAEHPDMLRRLREEVLKVVGGTRRPTYDDIRDMKYLRAFINETLRLYPPVPVNSRMNKTGSIWPAKAPGQSPFYIPKDTLCAYSVFRMHRRLDLWGPDALEFDPNRFLDERLHKYLTPNPFIFLPFNAGPRICLGQQFAYNETSFMLIRLLQQFEQIELTQEVSAAAVPPPGWAQSAGSNGKDRVWVRKHLTMYANGGLWVRMGEAVPESS